MSTNLRSLDLPDGMSSNDSDLLSEFYVPCLSSAVIYQRAAGYFSGGLIALAALAFADFTLRGGRMKLICSPNFRREDLEVLQSDTIPSSISRKSAYDNLVALRDVSDLSGALMTALSSLIHSEVLEVKVLIPERKSSRLFHDKLGIFSDGIDQISFIGSANETVAAWAETGNHENIEVFRSWHSEPDLTRIRRHQADFEVIWRGPHGWRAISRLEMRDMVFTVSRPQEIDVSLARVRAILEASRLRSRLSQSVDREPRIKDIRTLRPHQSAVIESWKQQERRGIVAFATGGGKTLAAISVIKEHIESGRPTLVLVPSRLLHDQWTDEIRQEIPDALIIPFGVDHSVRGREGILRSASSTGRAIMLSTYATACTDAFLRAFAPSDDLLIVADEVHTSGQPEFCKFLEVPFAGPRMGLSATPERYGDADGTDALFRYFGQILEPRFGIAEAIAARQLVPYEYSFEIVSLSEDEFAEWKNLSARIAKAAARAETSSENKEFYNLLLNRRARIAKSAIRKPAVASSLIRENFREGDRWLVYCSDRQQMNTVRGALSPLGIPILDYHDQMLGGRQETLDVYSKGGGIMLAIRCLDEGVDIPEINKALILASSTNPRQYIQRRGRVLRQSPATDKRSASIWDTLVADPQGRLLTIGEAVRAREFAKTSMSPATQIVLNGLLVRSGMTIDTDSTDFEEDLNVTE